MLRHPKPWPYFYVSADCLLRFPHRCEMLIKASETLALLLLLCICKLFVSLSRGREMLRKASATVALFDVFASCLFQLPRRYVRVQNVCVCVCIYTCVCVCVCVCICTYMCICIYIHLAHFPALCSDRDAGNRSPSASDATTGLWSPPRPFVPEPTQQGELF
jgi:hypothetical protein